MADDVQIGLDIDLDGSNVVVLTRQVNSGAKKRQVLLAMRKTRILIKYFMPHGGHANRMPILPLCLPGLLRTSVPSATMYYLKNKTSQLLEEATYQGLILYCCSISWYSVTMETGRGGNPAQHAFASIVLSLLVEGLFYYRFYYRLRTFRGQMGVVVKEA